ncbi:recombinase family protein [Lacipirellula sp.]|uniref:recombinase family protein n=1 Tax=Lacipirellula sp. TaxID=2691419 RepID=UPI003D0BA000
MKHVAIYCRVSGKTQETRSQMPELERYAAAHEAEVIWYIDKFSGKTMDRPAWLKLQTAINHRQVSDVVVWRLDRLGRTAKGLTALFEDLHERKINLVSLREGIDLTTPAGRMMCNILGSVAAYETEVRGERVLAGQAAARAAGKKWGGGTKGKRTKVTPQKEALIRSMYAEQTPITVIAQTLHLSRPTIYTVLNADKPAETAAT